MWNANATTFYFDDALVATLTTNVPYEPSYFVWNSVSTPHAYAPHIVRHKLNRRRAFSSLVAVVVWEREVVGGSPYARRYSQDQQDRHGLRDCICQLRRRHIGSGYWRRGESTTADITT